MFYTQTEMQVKRAEWVYSFFTVNSAIRLIVIMRTKLFLKYYKKNTNNCYVYGCLFYKFDVQVTVYSDKFL